MTFNLTAQAGDFSRAIHLATAVAGSGKMVPILKACRIVVGKQGGTVSATNGDHGASISFPATGNGECFMDMALISAKASLLKPGQDVTVSGDKDGKFVTVSQGRTRWRVPLVDGDAFPETMTEAVTAKPVTVDRAALWGAISAAEACVDAGDNRIIGRGVYLDSSIGFIAVAASGRALYGRVAGDTPLPVSVVVPNGSIGAMIGMFRSGATVDVSVTDQAMSVSADGVLYRTKLIEGTYVNWRAVAEMNRKGHDGQVTIPRQAAIDMVSRAAAISFVGAKGSHLSVRITITADEVHALASNRDGEEGYDAIPATGDPGTFAMGTDLLLNALSGLDGSDVTLRYSTKDDGPVVIGTDDDFRLLMNMRAK